LLFCDAMMRAGTREGCCAKSSLSYGGIDGSGHNMHYKFALFALFALISSMAGHV
jgi:hypothetical protein